MDRLVPGEPVAFDDEHQTVLRKGALKWKERLGWVAVVNTKGESVLDVFAAYDHEDKARKEYPPERFGVGMEDLLFDNGAVRAKVVEKWLAEIFEDRPVVMHDKSGDMKLFEHETPFVRATVQDTQDMYLSGSGQRQGLAKVAREILHREVQVGDKHTPTEDAATTMDLYLLKHPYDRVAEKAKLEAQGMPTTSQRNRNGGRGHHSQNSRGGRGSGNGRGFLQERASNRAPTRGDQSWAGEAFIRPARGGQRRGRGGKKSEQEN